jgi:hypothetical protein
MAREPGRAFRLFAVATLIAACDAPVPSASLGAALPTATSGIYPSFVPDATRDGALPLRQEVWVNPDVADRPGVPDELRHRYWWTWNGDAGSLGTTAQIGLPAGEQIETVQDGIVVAARWPIGDPFGELELVVRDFETGDVIRVIPTALRTIDAALVGSDLFWTGVLAGDPLVVVDGGIWGTDVLRTREPVEIVAAGAAFSGGLCGRGLEASPSGRTLAVRANCNGARLWTDIVDTGTLTRTARLDKQWVVAVTDDVYLLADFLPSDGVTWGQGGVSAVDLESGTELWRFPQRNDIDRFTSGAWGSLGSGFVSAYYWKTADGHEVVLSIFDPRTGTARALLRQADNNATLWASFGSSGPDHLVLTAGWDLREQIDLGGTPISVLDVNAGRLERDAFVIDPPELCFEDFCRTD